MVKRWNYKKIRLRICNITRKLTLEIKKIVKENLMFYSLIESRHVDKGCEFRSNIGYKNSLWSSSWSLVDTTIGKNLKVFLLYLFYIL